MDKPMTSPRSQVSKVKTVSWPLRLAPQFSASLSSNRFGSSSSTTTEVAIPIVCNFSAAASTILSAPPCSPASRSAKCESVLPDGEARIFHEELTTRASAPRGHWRSATAPIAASAPFDPSTPTTKRTGAPGSTSFSLFSVATDMPCRVEQEVGRSCGFLRNEQRKTPLAVGVFHQPISYPRTPAIEEHSLLLLRSRISITWQEVDIR